MRLHFNASVRTLRKQLEWLNDARGELVESRADPRLPRGVAEQQIAQCDNEIDEITEALIVLDAFLANAAPKQLVLGLEAA